MTTSIANRNNKVVLIFGFIIIIFLSGLYFLSHKVKYNSSANSTITPTIDTRPHIILQKSKVALGENIELQEPRMDVSGSRRILTSGYVIFTLVDITNDSITVRNESVGDKTIKDKDCLYVGSRVTTDIWNKYCFSISNVDSIINISYESITESWLSTGN